MILCNNCQKPVHFEEKEQIYLHNVGGYWCDRKKTTAVDVTHPMLFQTTKAGFTMMGRKDGKIVKVKSKTQDYLEIDTNMKLLRTPHNQEMFTKYGLEWK